MNGEPWFRPKRYGYGATPINWQGWTFTGAMVALLIALRLILLPADAAVFGLVVLVWLAALLIVVNVKSSSPLRWRWGQRKAGDN